MATQHDRHTMRFTAAAAMVACVVHASRLQAQTATDGCGFGAGSAYTVGSACAFQPFNKPGSFNADLAPTTCGAGNFDDAFGWFTATGTTTHITFDPASNHDAVLHVYTGTCGTLVEQACANAGGNGVNETVTLTTTAGTTYLVRVQRVGTNNNMDGALCVWTPPPPPANDDPCAAVALPVGTGCTGTSATTTSATGTAGIPAPGCAGYSGGDVWFTVTAPGSGNITLETTAGGLTDAGMALYSASACNGTFTLIECDDNDGAGNMPMIQRTGLTPGQTYYVRVWGNAGATGTFSACAYDNTVVNDNPCSAIAVATGTTCSFSNHTNVGGTLTAGIPAPGCGNLGTSADVWFTFTAPASGFVSIATQAGTLTNAAMALYSAPTCSGAMTLIDCDANDGAGNMPFLAFSDLVGGNTYYLRIWGEGTATGTFGLCLTAPPTTGDCFYALNMTDAFGDGWGGSTVGISINGGPATTYTLANGEQGVAYIPVTIGQTLSVQYTAAGGFQNEIGYSLQLGAGALLNAGPSPATGTVYTGVADCIAPNAPGSDCQGGSTICNAQSFNGSPSNTGLVADLNVQTRGCLATNERQGLWYNFSPATGGTVAFTISPTNNADDYDFAVWGPFTSLNCADKGSPLRCSYSALGGNTGLQAGAGDNSEGAAGNKWVEPITVLPGQVYLLYISNYSLSGLAFDLTWQLTNGATLDCTVLPVELVAFDAVVHGDAVHLSWSTATERNSDHFVVERSADAFTFGGIAQVDAAGNTLVRTDYTLTDEAPLPGTSYYRLRQVDLDGTASLSPARSVTFIPPGPHLQVRPNPVQDLLQAHIDAQEPGEAMLRVLDGRGAVVLQQRVQLAPGPQVIPVAVQGLSAGIHVLTLTTTSRAPAEPVRFVVK